MRAHTCMHVHVCMCACMKAKAIGQLQILSLWTLSMLFEAVSLTGLEASNLAMLAG